MYLRVWWGVDSGQNADVDTQGRLGYALYGQNLDPVHPVLDFLCDRDLELLLFFFFQAEDGIRDLTVTGVQTCALPISTWLNDEPLVHGNDLHLLAIAAYAKSRVTVLLSGEGADETLGGYVRYRPLQIGRASGRGRG